MNKVVSNERKTCRIVYIEFDDGTLQYRLELSCGDTVYYDEMRGPNFCPECGALVVRGRRSLISSNAGAVLPWSTATRLEG